MKKLNVIKSVAIIVMTIGALLNIALSFTLAEFITSVQHKDFNAFYKTILFVVIFLVSELVFSLIAIKLRMSYVKKSLIHINSSLFNADMKNLNDIDMSSYSTKTELFVNHYLLNKIAIPFFILQILITLTAYFIINPIYVIYMIVITVLMMSVPLLTQSKTQELTGTYTNASKDYINYLTNIFGGKREIKQYKVLEQYKKNHCNVLTKLFDDYEKYGRYLRNINAFSNSVSTLTFLGLQVISGFLILTGRMELGLFLTAIQLMNYFISPVFSLVESLNNYSSIKNQVPNKQEAVFETETETKTENVLNLKDKIEINNLEYRYNGEEKLSYPKNMKFEKNKKYLITGKSGSGKSTLAKILSGDLTDYAGEIFVDGVSQNKGEKQNDLSLITYVPQSGHLFYDSILENIDMYRNMSKDTIHTAISLANLEENLLKKEIDLTSEVSGGEKARVVLARSFASMPSVMIIDEPTANLDYKNSIEIIKKICDIENLTLIVISHETDTNFINCFDTVITL